MEYSKFNNARRYRRLTVKLMDKAVEEYGSLHVYETERIEHTTSHYRHTPTSKLDSILDDINIAIIEEVAVSKFLSVEEIFDFITLRGVNVSFADLKNRLFALTVRRILQTGELVCDESRYRLRYYELDCYGYMIATAQGVKFNKGNAYMPYSEKRARKLPDDTPFDVKRVIGGNRIILSMLKNGVKMERFGIMETVRPLNVGAASCLLRTSAYVRIDEATVLIYDVVRDLPDTYEALKNKVGRYYELVNSPQYLEKNYHDDKVYPQLVLCGESHSHNMKIAAYLKEHGAWSEKDPILFTEDQLVLRRPHNSLYGLNDDNSQQWYVLPSVNKPMPISPERMAI